MANQKSETAANPKSETAATHKSEIDGKSILLFITS
jgi:hypothetical protein